MTTREQNIVNALVTATEVVKEMIKQGFVEGKYVHKLTQMICRKYSLSEEDSLYIVEKAIEISFSKQ